MSSSSESPGTPRPDRRNRGTRAAVFSEALSFLNSVGILLVLALNIRGTVVEAFRIPSGSMIPTLKIDDHIFVWKLSYGLRLIGLQKALWNYATPKRGDVVVFTREDDPATSQDETDTNIIKRVIGLPGDSVEVREAQVFINGTALEEPYARWEDGGSPEGNFGPQQVPDGHLFMLGDNRDRSKDSRYWNGSHFLPLHNVKGKAFIIYWSSATFSRIGNIIR